MKRLRLFIFLYVSGACALAWVVQDFVMRWAQVHWLPAEYEPPPPGMVFIPAGEFVMGSEDPAADPDEGPRRRVFLPAYYIDRYEVTNRDYKRFKKEHDYPEGADDVPVSFVLKKEAEAYARFVGKRLPTSAEWEKAARGVDGRLFPWGNTFDPTRCNVRAPGSDMGSEVDRVEDGEAGGSARGKLPVGTFPSGSSPYGVMDMCGNVWEWVSDVWVDRDWLGGSGAQRRGVIKGGGYGYSEKQCRLSYQGFEALDSTCHDVGFRCVLEAVPKRY